MSESVTKAGPYFSSGSISFSSLRNAFKETTSGSIKASELRRNTDTENRNPIVPDATENSPISTGSNLKVSQFRNSIKYYYITQSGTDENLIINDLSWNLNLYKSIRKWVYIGGNVGSNTTSVAAARLTATAYNLTIDVTGNIFGAGGAGGTSGNISGGTGGAALRLSSPSGSNIVVNVSQSGKIYGGGGGGEKGATGANGVDGTCTESFTQQGPCGECPSCPDGYTVSRGCYEGRCCQSYSYCCGLFNCACEACSKKIKYVDCTRSYPAAGGLGGEGGDGGPGRGYNNLTGSLSGANGSPGGSNNGCQSTDGKPGNRGGDGGDWGLPGNNTTNTGNGGSAGRAIEGSNYSVVGTINSTTIKGLYNPS
jgi:hypothetical protein